MGCNSVSRVSSILRVAFLFNTCPFRQAQLRVVSDLLLNGNWDLERQYMFDNSHSQTIICTDSLQKPLSPIVPKLDAMQRYFTEEKEQKTKKKSNAG